MEENKREKEEVLKSPFWMKPREGEVLLWVRRFQDELYPCLPDGTLISGVRSIRLVEQADALYTIELTVYGGGFWPPEPPPAGVVSDFTGRIDKK